MNKLELMGEIVYMEPKRFTPAGLPIQIFRIKHESTQSEANLNKLVNMEIESIIIGDLVNKGISVGEKLLFQGFLDKRSKKSMKIIYHITDIKE
ncbi:MAG: primosomal replication protein N [Methylophilaceae bacterium]